MCSVLQPPKLIPMGFPPSPGLIPQLTHDSGVPCKSSWPESWVAKAIGLPPEDRNTCAICGLASFIVQPSSLSFLSSLALERSRDFSCFPDRRGNYPHRPILTAWWVADLGTLSGYRCSCTTPGSRGDVTSRLSGWSFFNPNENSIQNI